MSASVDAAVLALLVATPVHTFDGYVTDSDENEKTISAPLPYLVYYTSPGYPVNPRMGGTKARATEFQVSFVGESRQQAVWAGAKAEAALDGVSVVIDGKPRQIRRTIDNLFVRRDDTWTRPDGGPLFYGALRFTV